MTHCNSLNRLFFQSQFSSYVWHYVQSTSCTQNLERFALSAAMSLEIMPALLLQRPNCRNIAPPTDSSNTANVTRTKERPKYCRCSCPVSHVLSTCLKRNWLITDSAKIGPDQAQRSTQNPRGMKYTHCKMLLHQVGLATLLRRSRGLPLPRHVL